MPTLSSNIVKREIASVQDVEEALARQSLYGGDLVTNLLELARVSEDRLTQAVAESLGLSAAPAGELPRAPDHVRRLVPGDVAHRYVLYPLQEIDGKLIVAVGEPLPAEVVSDLEFSLGVSIEQRAATVVRIQQAVSRDYGLELDRRVARVLARLNGDPDPHPSGVPPPAPATSPEPSSIEPPSTSTAPEPVATDRPSRTSLPVMPRVDVAALARAEARARRRQRRLGPYTAAMAEADLRDAETRDEVMGAFFDFASQYFDYSALFAVHGDLAEGRDAHGSGAPRAKVLTIGVPLDLPSTLASVTANEPYRLARLSSTGLDGALAKDLERRPGPAVLLLPIRVRDRAVLVLYGDHGAQDVELGAVGDVISFAPLVSRALERLILRRKGLPDPARLPGVRRLPGDRHADRARLPNAHDRASALATALIDAPLAPIARISSPAPAPESNEPRAAQPTGSQSMLPRPVISIGPKRRPTPPQGAAIPRLPEPPRELAETVTAETPAATPVWPKAYSLPPTKPTPVPSSLAPGAPPEPARPRKKLLVTPSEAPPPDAAPAPPAAVNGFSSTPPATKPGVGTAPAQPEASSPSQSSASVKKLELVAEPDSAPPPAREGDPEPLPDALGAEPDVVPDLVIEEAVIDSADGAMLEELLAEVEADEELTPLAPQSRSLAFSARPLPPSQYSEELRLPTVIVDLASDTEALVERLIQGDAAAAERIVEIGAAAVPALVGAFPGPILSELRRGIGDGPPRASECGPVLKALARIGPKAAGVLGVRTNDGQASVRAWATRLLGEMPCPDAARAVARRFVDEDPDVRRAALAAGRMLQNHANAGGVLAATLSEMLLDTSRKDAQTHMIIEAVADLREARAIPALASLLAAGSPDVQRSAHWALVVLARTDFGDNAAAWDQWWRVNCHRHRIEWLIDALMHEVQEIRRAAGDELKSVTKEYFGYYDDLPPRERERAQHRYREWWDTKGKARFAPSPPTS